MRAARYGRQSRWTDDPTLVLRVDAGREVRSPRSFANDARQPCPKTGSSAPIGRPHEADGRLQSPALLVSSRKALRHFGPGPRLTDTAAWPAWRRWDGGGARLSGASAPAFDTP